MNSDLRLAQLDEWIKETLGVSKYSLIPVSGDASFRRYFRFKADKAQYIAVDAPPEKESNESFVNITHLLESEGLPVPHIFFSSLDLGFFLLDDFGDTLLLEVLDKDSANTLYKKALEALIIIQQTPATSLPSYDNSLLMTEMELFREWYLQKHLSIVLTSTEQQLLDKTFKVLAENALNQPQVFVHRDYHSRNLMKIDNNYPGIIDYQDAVRGPITYDLVSLLRDCYIKWPQQQIKSWALTYRDQIVDKKIIESIDDQTFLKWFDLMGIQRHLKAIGIFSRLNMRDNKPNYLHDIPRTLEYITTVAPKYSETQLLANIIQDSVSL
ncbi:MAG: aminoglycoside phosphotransferase family protein [Gammaproteobacteria bacterium]